MAVINARMSDMLNGAIGRLESGRAVFSPAPGDQDYLHDRSLNETETHELGGLLAVGARLLVRSAGDVAINHDFISNPAESNLRAVGVTVDRNEAGLVHLTTARTHKAA